MNKVPASERVAQALLKAGRAAPEALAEATGLKVGTVKNKLTELHHKGKAAPVGDGTWEPVVTASSPSPRLCSDDDASGVSPPVPDPVTQEGSSA